MPNEQDPRDEARWQALSMRRSELELAEIFRVLGEHGIEAIAFKGWAAARNYPTGHFRNFSDIDIAVRSDQHSQAFEIIKAGKLAHLNIDLHLEFRHLDRSNWNDLFARSSVTTIEGVAVRSLSPEDHLRVLSAHWLNDGGEYKERLWDIYYAVARRPDNFDWEICLNSVPANRRNWVTTSLILAQRYLGLNISDIPLRDDELVIPQWVENRVLREWDSNTRLVPLSSAFKTRTGFWRQVKKRMPPNPIQATIEADGIFDETGRLGMQISTAFRRLTHKFRKRR